MAMKNKSALENMQYLGERMLDYMRLQKIPNKAEEAHDVMSLVNDIMDVTIEYFFQGRISLHTIWLKDRSCQIFNPEVALHLLKNSFRETPLFPCIWCGVSHLTQQSLESHMEVDHRTVMKDDVLMESSSSVPQETEIVPPVTVKTEESSDGSYETSQRVRKRKRTVDVDLVSDDDTEIVDEIVFDRPGGTPPKKSKQTNYKSEKSRKKNQLSRRKTPAISRDKSTEMMKKFHTLGDDMLECLSLEKIRNGPSEAEKVVNFCKHLIDASMDFFSHGRFSLYAVWIKDECNRIMNPETALHLLRTQLTSVVLFLCESCGTSHLTQEALNLHVQTEHSGYTPPKSQAVKQTSPPKSKTVKQASPPKSQTVKQASPPKSQTVKPTSPPKSQTVKQTSPPKAQTVKQMSLPKAQTARQSSRLRSQTTRQRESSSESATGKTFTTASLKDEDDISENPNSGSEEKVNVTKVKTEPVDCDENFTDGASESTETLDAIKSEAKSCSVIDLTADEPPFLQFTCSICSSEQEVNDGGVEHYSNIHGLEILSPAGSCTMWPCIYCSEVFNKNEELLVHLTTLHGVIERWTCVYCPEEFLRRRAFAVHMMGHCLSRTSLQIGRQSWSCFLCQFVGANPDHILRHMNQQHLKQEVTSNDVRSCPRCGIAGFFGSVSRHLNRVCIICKEMFCQTSDLVEHLVDFHSDKKHWQCAQCKLCLSGKHNLKRHILTVHLKEDWPCPKCTNVCISREFLINHLINLHHTQESQAKSLAENVHQNLNY